MAHVQQQILDGVQTALIAAATAAGARVYLDRVDTLEEGDLPALLVQESPEGESIDPKTVSGLEQRTFSVLVAAVVAHGTDYAKEARALGLQVEQVLGVSSFAVPKPGRARIVASRITLSGEGNQAMAAKEQTWRFTYFTRRGAPDTAS
ncbi:hypothetical protein [Variovorax sp. LT1R16]|uniref:hypothetical protein n=1 Tax=Variovorax sp. LT1R16 TaxID=3443728 RepID=UPI003F461145